MTVNRSFFLISSCPRAHVDTQTLGTCLGDRLTVALVFYTHTQACTCMHEYAISVWPKTQTSVVPEYQQTAFEEPMASVQRDTRAREQNPNTQLGVPQNGQGRPLRSI